MTAPILLALLGIPTALAAEPDVTIRLRPHCVQETSCPEFVRYDGETLITNGQKAGDTLDLDVVLTNPSGQTIQSVQSWLAYDATVLQGVDVRVDDAFPLVAPGEEGFDDAEGIVKLGASNVSGGMIAKEFVFARVQFQVLSPRAEPVLIRFHEFHLLGQEGKTKALIVEEGRTVNVLRTRPWDLWLHFGDNPPPSVLPAPIPPPGQPVMPAIPAVPDTGFSRLQVGGVRIATDQSRVSLAWDTLPDPNVAGYRVYYGTVSGRYIQRRAVPAGERGVTIEGLPAGTRYFFAVTAVDGGGQESEFSYEVSAVAGEIASATSPFVIDASSLRPVQPVPLPPGRVPARTGASLAVMLAIAIAVSGGGVMFLRFRRP